MKALMSDRPKCPNVLARLGAYVDGELQEASRQRLEAHLDACRNCSAELERLQSLREHLRQSLAVPLRGQDAQQFWDNVGRKIQEASASRWWSPTAT